MSSLRIGIIGAGNIGQTHAETLRSLGETIDAVADIDERNRMAFAESFEIPSTYDDHRTMLADEPLDLVVVAVPNALHAECAIAALEADVDVFVEKPLAHTLADAERIADTARTSDGSVMVGFVRAFESWAGELKDRIADGTFGHVYDVDAEYVRRRGIPQLGSWFTQKRVSGGGALIDVGVHVLHLTLYLLDFPTIETVSATTGNHFGTKDDYTYLSMWGGGPIDDGTFDVDDYARVFLRTADGTTIHLHLSWAINDSPTQSIRVHGVETGAVTEIENGKPRVNLYSTNGSALSDTELTYSDTDRFANQWSYVTDVVRGDRELTKNTLEEGLLVQRLIDAIYESAETGREVDLR